MSSKYNFKTTGAQIAADFSAQIKGKTILVTGVSKGGLGDAFIETLAPHNPALVILAGRNAEKLKDTAAALASSHPTLQTRSLTLDLSSQAQVRQAAAEVNSWTDVPRIDVLVNNAGIMAVPYGKTPEGLELQFGTNHIGHFLFTNLIIEKILASNFKRIVSVASNGYRMSYIRFADIGFQNGEVYNKWRAYGQAKTANMLFAVSLAKKLQSKGVTALSLHPGAISTNLASSLPDLQAEIGELMAFAREIGLSFAEGPTGLVYKSMEEGVATHMRAAFDPSLTDFNGSFLTDSEVCPAENVHSWGRDPVDAEKLWKLSEEIVGQTFEY